MFSKLVTVIFVLYGFLAIADPESKTLVLNKGVRECEVGDGEWNAKVLRRPNGTVYSVPPCIDAVDNSGRVYVCDTLRDRILVFSLKGKGLSIIKGVPRPFSVEAGNSNKLLVTGVKRGKQEQFLGKRRESGNWDFSVIDTNQQLFMIGPKDNLAYTSDDYSTQLRKIVKRDTSTALPAPSKYYDKQTNFYIYQKSSEYKDMAIINDKGEKINKYNCNTQGRTLVRYKRGVYVYSFPSSPNKPITLKKCSPTGMGSEKIRILGIKHTTRPVFPPDTQHIYFAEEKSDYSLHIYTLKKKK